MKIPIAAAAAVVAVLAYSSAYAATAAEAKRFVANRMKDPGSVQFRDVRSYGGGVVCGESNAKNGYGAYTGFKAFVYVAGPRYTFKEPNASDYDVASLCSKDVSMDRFAQHAWHQLEPMLVHCKIYPEGDYEGETCEQVADRLRLFKVVFHKTPTGASLGP